MPTLFLPVLLHWRRPTATQNPAAHRWTSIFFLARSVVANRKGLNKEEYQKGSELHRYIAYGIDDIERSKSVRNELNDHINVIENKSINDIHTFIEKCNDYFK